MNTPRAEVFQANGHTYYTLSYNPEAPGTPIVLIHGLLLNPHFWWEDHVRQWIDFGPVYSISLTGHYPSLFSPDFSGPLDAGFMADMVAEQIKHLVGDRPVILIGHSTGALAGLCATITYPDQVKALGILSTLPHGREDSGVFGFFQWLHCSLGPLGALIFKYITKLNSSSLAVHRFLMSDAAKSTKKLFSYPRFNDYIASYLGVHKKLDHRSMGIWFKGLRTVDITERCTEIRCPVLLMYSRHDKYMDYRTMDLIQAKMPANPAVTTCLVEDAGHLYMFEAADVYRQAMETWMRSLQLVLRH